MGGPWTRREPRRGLRANGSMCTIREKTATQRPRVSRKPAATRKPRQEEEQAEVKLATAVNRNGQAEPAVIVGSTPYSLREGAALLGGPEALGAAPEAFADMLALIDGGPDAWQAARRVADYVAALEDEARRPLALESLLAPIPRPRKNVVCVGRNYAAHAHERGAEAPGDPVFFTKAPTTVVGPDARVPYPAATQQFDYEGELAVIIGRKGRNIPRDEAFDYVFGYTIANDLTARDLQKRHQQWFRGKSLDATCPMGPWIVTPDELGPVDQLRLETRVNGELRQEGFTEHMIFDIPTLIAVLSDGMTLEPGDIIMTGTPAGVGAALGKLLAPGDRVDITIDGIGTLTTYIVPSS